MPLMPEQPDTTRDQNQQRAQRVTPGLRVRGNHHDQQNHPSRHGGDQHRQPEKLEQSSHVLIKG
jgi:hypothetical protein